MSIWWSLHLRREVASVPLARRLLLGTMETAGVDPDVAYEVAVALSEACSNAVEHGASDRSDGYLVSACIDGDMCHVEVTDAGPGFSAAALGHGAEHGSAPGVDLNQGPDREPCATPPEVPYVPAAPYAAPEPAAPEAAVAAVPAPGTGAVPLGTGGAEPDPVAESGRGLHLIETLADHVHVHNRPGHGGAVVSFDKILKWRDDALLRAG